MHNDWLIPFARCPVTRSALLPADGDLLGRINQAISQQQLVNCDQLAVTRPLSGGLVNADRTLLYPIWEQIPALVPAEAIPLAPVESGDRENE